MKEFSGTVTSTWTNLDDNCEHHIWRAWGYCGAKGHTLHRGGEAQGGSGSNPPSWILNRGVHG